MRKTSKHFLTAVFLAVAVVFAFIQASMAQMMPCNYKEYGLDAEKFYVYLTQDTPYAHWSLLPGTGKLSPGKEPHGAFLTTYANPVAMQSIADKKGMEFGSLFVVENYDRDKKLTSLAVMIKIKGYNPAKGDWHWFHYAPDGKVLATGRVDSCIQCHETMKDNDFVMAAPLK